MNKEKLIKYMNQSFREVGGKGVVLDDVQYFRFGANKFALSVWKEKKDVAADPEGEYRGREYGDPHSACIGSVLTHLLSKGNM